MAPPTSTLHLDVEAISGICGSISIACWIVVFSPQIIQNFQRSSADGLSIQFIIIWLLGDVFNIIGAVMQGVLPTMIILAIYYTLADIVLLAQCFYYRGFTWRDEPTPAPKPNSRPDERTALLESSARARDHHGERRHSADWTGLSPAVPHMPEAPSKVPTVLQSIFWNSVIVVMVCAAGVLGWFLGQKKGSHDDDGHSVPDHPQSDNDTLHFNVVGQVFGYLCTVAYIASRLPQLILNYRRKTTDGLSMLFFLFACLGNVTYVLSIFAYEPKCGDRECHPGESGRIYGKYMLVNLSWLAGSLVTLFMDLGVFAQYFVYRAHEDGLYTVEEETEPSENGHGHGHGESNGNGRPSNINSNSNNNNDDNWDQRPLLQRGDSGNA